MAAMQPSFNAAKPGASDDGSVLSKIVSAMPGAKPVAAAPGEQATGQQSAKTASFYGGGAAGAPGSGGTMLTSSAPTPSNLLGKTTLLGG